MMQQPTPCFFKSDRYGILELCGLIFVVISAMLRLALLGRSWQLVPHDPVLLGRIFMVGALYDTLFFVYFSLFFGLLLLVTPGFIYRSRFYRLGVRLAVFLFLAGSYFLVAAEWLYWDEFNVRFNFIAIDYLMYSYEVTHNITESYPVAAILSAVLVAAAMTFPMLNRRLTTILTSRDTFSARLAAMALLVVLATAGYLSIDQSFREAPGNNYLKELSSNGPYQFFAAFRNNSLDYSTFYVQGNETELSHHLKRLVGKNPETGPLFDISRRVTTTGAEKRLNVFLLSIESLSVDFLSRFGEKADITPFMDQWFNQGLLFTNFYATGTRTTRGLESITLSVPPTPGRSLIKRPDNSNFYNLGWIFKDHGYDVAFLYGGRGFFDNMNAFFSGNGYRIIDQTDLNGEEITFQNAWGVADGDLYRKALSEADRAAKRNTPFFYHLMTTSNHRPFTYPTGTIDIPSGTGRHGAVKYCDYALGRFIEAARTRSWFAKTLFVVVADHCASSAGRAELPVDRYHIPLFFFAPGYIKPGEVTRLSDQLDLAPTLLAMLNFSYESYFFGRNILAENFEERALIGNYQRLGLFEHNELVILAPVKQIKVIDDPRNNDRALSADSRDTTVATAMALYQGADYILKNRLNRVQ